MSSFAWTVSPFLVIELNVIKCQVFAELVLQTINIYDKALHWGTHIILMYLPVKMLSLPAHAS